MKKVGILSMQNSDNFGSVLQAYGLKKIVETLGENLEVYFVNIKKIEEDNSLLNGFNLLDKYEREYIKPGFNLKKIDRYFLKRVYRKFVDPWDKQITYFKKFREDSLEIWKSYQKLDLCIIGSDEVFNCLQPSSWGYTSQLYGNVSEAQSVITYAASCGATKYEELPGLVVESIHQAVEKLQGVSVRDKNTNDFISKFYSGKIEKHLDPAFINDFSKEIQECDFPKLPAHYCLIYSYNNRINKISEYKAILKFCSSKGLTPITIYGRQIWCKKHIICSPFECLKVFQNADFVITDTFHGTIFSAKYSEKFAVIIRDSNYYKLSDLIDRLNINQHLVNDITKLDLIYQLHKEQEKIDNVIEKERKKSMKYLGEYINGTE